ncbi:MAG: hypothetical protein ACI4E1_09655 [Lachnospira sp.]
MYYRTSGSYRKSKMIIDYCNIVLTIAITVLFVAILFLRGKSGIIFPIEFLLGTLVNGLTAAKNFMNGNKVKGSVLCVITGLLLGMALISWKVVMK